MDLVPATAKTVVVFRPKELLEDPYFRMFYNAKSRMSLSIDIENFETERGIDMGSVEKVIIFNDRIRTPMSDADGYGATIIRGGINIDRIKGKMEGKGLLGSEQYGSYTLYFVMQTYFAFVDDNTVVVGSKDAVVDVLDVKMRKSVGLTKTSVYSSVFKTINKGAPIQVLGSAERLADIGLSLPSDGPKHAFDFFAITAEREGGDVVFTSRVFCLSAQECYRSISDYRNEVAGNNKYASIAERSSISIDDEGIITATVRANVNEVLEYLKQAPT